MAAFRTPLQEPYRRRGHVLVLNLVVGLLVFVGPARVGADGNSLLKQCAGLVSILDRSGKEVSRMDASDHGFCVGFMQGITQTSLVYRRILGKQALFCLPADGIQNGQAARVVVKYLSEHPEELHNPEIVLAVSAFKEAFPCDPTRQ